VIEEQQRGLRQSEKLQAVGQLAGGIAHDFGNVLEGVVLAANAIVRAPEKTDRVMRAARLIERASRRGSELTSQILNFARGGRGHRRPVAMDAVVRDVAELLQRTLDSSVTLRTELGAGAATVLADPGQMQQVVMNLALNARDAMPDGGKLELTTDVVHLDGTEEYLALPTEPGDYVRVVVSDEGTGIPEAVQSRMFEPFFTTKQGGRNAGMGLATVYGIVKALGGEVSCESKEGQGTRFSLHLPASADAEEEPQDTGGAAPASAGRYSILLVEDDADVRSMAADCLSDAGHNVAEAGDGVEGLARFKESSAGFDLVVLDLSMPRMGGEECLLAIRGVKPDAKFLLTTGFLVEGELAAEVESGKLVCLRKPYDEARLLIGIDEIMGAARSEQPVGHVELTH
jgi:CheY-like chemotaxis protein